MVSGTCRPTWPWAVPFEQPFRAELRRPGRFRGAGRAYPVKQALASFAEQQAERPGPSLIHHFAREIACSASTGRLVPGCGRAGTS